MQHSEVHEDYLTWLQMLRAYPYAVGIDEPLLSIVYPLQESQGTSEIGTDDISYLPAGRVSGMEILQDVFELYDKWFEKVCYALKIHRIFK